VNVDLVEVTMDEADLIIGVTEATVGVAEIDTVAAITSVSDITIHHYIMTPNF